MGTGRSSPTTVVGDSISSRRRPKLFAAAPFVETLEALAVGALVALFAALPEWRCPGFYFHDDMQLQYVPGMVEIGRAARSGHLALLSSSSWYGGALAGEYQDGVFSVFHVFLCDLAKNRRHGRAPVAGKHRASVRHRGGAPAGHACRPRAHALALRASRPRARTAVRPAPRDAATFARVSLSSELERPELVELGLRLRRGRTPHPR